MWSRRSFIPLLIALTVLVAAIVGYLAGANGLTLDSNLAGVCATARAWRDAAEEIERTSNIVDRSSQQGQSAMNAVYKTLANVTIPSASPGSAQAALAEAMHRLNSAAERWLSSNQKFHSVAAASGTTVAQRLTALDEQESARLQMNEAYRLANSQLASVCGIKPMEVQ